MFKKSGLFAVAILTLSVLMWSTNALIGAAVNNYVSTDAKRKAEIWADFFAVNMVGLPQLITDGRPTEKQLEHIQIAASVGGVFRFKLFNEQGNLVLISDELAPNLAPGSTYNDYIAATYEKNIDAADVIRTKTANISLNDGTLKDDRPDLYVEAYVPVLNQNNEIIGVVEVYLDQSFAATALHGAFNLVLAALAAVFALAFGGPYVAFIFKSGQASLANKRADYLSKYDTTTGLMTRTSLLKSLEDRIANDDIELGQLGVAFIDIDNFKLINDSFGHKAGDAYLKHVGKAIEAEIGQHGMVGRIGGDEFVAIAERIGSSAMSDIAEKMRLQTSTPIVIDGATIKGSISIGIHHDVTHPKLSFEERMQKADIALYQSKLDGRDTCTFYEKSLENHIKRRRKIEVAITNAIDEGRMQVHFQPLLRRDDEKIAGFEALLRLKDHEGDNIPPLDFIPVAEKMGAIKNIGKWVIEQAALAASQWPEGLFVAVNLSARQFDDGTLVDQIKDILNRTGVDPSRLELEITEGLLIENTESVSKQLAQIGQMGISLAMDDFGTGYSSLAYLWQFGFNKIKIDKSFIAGLDADPKKVHEILDTIIMLGHKLDMTVTAEGIETTAQATALANLKCDHFQGYLYGRPMPVDELASFVMKNFAQQITVASNDQSKNTTKVQNG
ncbi:putative bifunctional diguanylate cyclase/phosphodiesterase [Maritalea sp.]|uniref:putative bifunctional diguanylate cyclase/phosphodiesterase n=1 Tax=Maritalea sp. TaxID=2003361 RepID=UPI003EF2FF0D